MTNFIGILALGGCAVREAYSGPPMRSVVYVSVHAFESRIEGVSLV